MIVGDILRLTVRATLLGQEVLNVFTYRIASLTGSISWQDTVTSPIVIGLVRPIAVSQHSALQYADVTVDNLSSPPEQYIVPIEDTGAYLTGDVMASFVAYTYKLVRATALTRNGSKRFAGVPEEYVSGNTVGFPAGVREDVEAALATTLDLYNEADEVVGTIVPVIVGRCRIGDVGCTVGDYDLTRVSDVASASYRFLSTQRSRKAGHGS